MSAYIQEVEWHHKLLTYRKWVLSGIVSEYKLTVRKQMFNSMFSLQFIFICLISISRSLVFFSQCDIKTKEILFKWQRNIKVGNVWPLITCTAACIANCTSALKCSRNQRNCCEVLIFWENWWLILRRLCLESAVACSLLWRWLL